MTAIALLNSELDPHLVADTLLSAEGPDPSVEKRIWMPALGSVQTEWGVDDAVWHISRLGRKSFFLPNQSGVLAFAGLCTPAAQFLDELSSAFRNIHQYDKTARIDRKLIDRVLRDNVRAKEFWLLGVLIDENGNREAYTHNTVKKIDTKSFGICYVSGSGAGLIEKMIRQADRRIVEAGGWRDTVRISATEDLAENISCEMLYRESDYRNGVDPNTPISVGCGGFYEWYAVLPQGIKPMRSRVDIHICFRDGKLLITRIHFCEQMESNTVKLIDMSLPSQDYYLSIYNLGLKTHEIPLQLELGEWTTIIPEETVGVLIESFFKFEDSAEKFKKPRLSASVSSEMAQKLFHKPLDVPRVRMIVTSSGVAITRGLISLRHEQASAQIKEIDGRIALRLSQKVMFALVESVAHLLSIETA